MNWTPAMSSGWSGRGAAEHWLNATVGAITAVETAEWLSPRAWPTSCSMTWLKQLALVTHCWAVALLLVMTVTWIMRRNGTPLKCSSMALVNHEKATASVPPVSEISPHGSLASIINQLVARLAGGVSPQRTVPFRFPTPHWNVDGAFHCVTMLAIWLSPPPASPGWPPACTSSRAGSVRHLAGL